MDHLDQCLAQFIETCWEEGEPRPWANDTIAALQFFVPSVKQSLGLSWALAGAWSRRELPARALPVTPQVVAALAGAFLIANEPRLAAAFVLGFDCLTRTAELLSLTLDDVQLALEGSAAVVRLRNTKTSGRAGVHESIIIDHEVARGALRFLCQDRLPGQRLVGCSDSVFRKRLAHVVGCLEMGSLGIRPYSMRRGGATQLFRDSGSFDVVAHRGRWMCISTCRRYVEDAAAQLAQLRLTRWQLEQLDALGSVYKRWAARHFIADSGTANWTHLL